MNKNLKILICALLLIEAIQPSIDPDLGWHLRYGQYFFETGHVLRDNILSFIWPWYHWVQASWGYDLVVDQLFEHFGFPGLSVASGLLVLLTFLIATWPQKRLSPLQLLLLAEIFMASVTPLWASGMRTPTLSTPFMALVLLLSDTILNPEERKSGMRHLILLPVIFFVWANVHGGFALGLILLTIFWAMTIALAILNKARHLEISLPSRATLNKFGLAIAVSWVTPLVNPWGLRIYEETFKHSTNVNLNVISEWQPLTMMTTESIVTGVIVLFTAVVLMWRNKFRAIPMLTILFVTTYLAYSANRFVIILGVLIVYILARNLPYMHLRPAARMWAHVALWITLITIVPLDMFYFHRYFQPPTVKVMSYTWSDYCDTTLYCSEGLTRLMRASPPVGNGFHPYNYGGYLIWRVPMVKTFIDGRMVAWEDNGQTPPAAEGDWVFMQNGPIAFTKFDNEYHFTWAIVPTQSGVTDYLDDLVKNHKWNRLYRDTNYSYYVKMVR